jgi:hypothetical protein
MKLIRIKLLRAWSYTIQNQVSGAIPVGEMNKGSSRMGVEVKYLPHMGWQVCDTAGHHTGAVRSSIATALIVES